MSRFLGIILIVALMHCASAFRATMPTNRGGLRLSKLSMAAKEAFQLVLIRHGESSWNKVNSCCDLTNTAKSCKATRLLLVVCHLLFHIDPIFFVSR